MALPIRAKAAFLSRTEGWLNNLSASQPVQGLSAFQQKVTLISIQSQT